MGWFLRKAFRLGPLRLNLSKRGVGISGGVKGARIGVDATGKPYVAGGRFGLYFRERFGGVRTSTGTGPAAPRSRAWVWGLVLLALVVGLALGVFLARA